MADGGFTRVRFDVLGVHLRPHAVLAEELTQGNSIRQVKGERRYRCGTRRNSGEANVLWLHTDKAAIGAVNAMLH